MTQKTNIANWFEIPVNDLEKAKKFYEKVFSIEMALNEMGPMRMAWFPMEQDVPFATGTLIQGEGYTPSHEGTRIYLRVENIDVALKKINENGGKTLAPKMSIGEWGFTAQFEDCEGNQIALHSDH